MTTFRRYNPAVNSTPMGNVYPGRGASTGLRGGTSTAFGANDPSSTVTSSSVAEVSQAAAGANTQRTLLQMPITHWFVLLGLLVVLMFSAEKWGSSDTASDFKTIKLSVYNIFIISTAAVIGLSLFKAAAAKANIKGLSEIILAA